MIEGGQMLSIVDIEDLEHLVALELAPLLLGACGNLGNIGGLRLLDDARQKRLFTERRVSFEPLPYWQVEVEFAPQRAFEARDFPLLLDALFWNVSAEQVVEHAGAEVSDAVGH